MMKSGTATYRLFALSFGSLIALQCAASADDTAAQIRLLKAQIRKLERKVDAQDKKQKETQVQIRNVEARPAGQSGPPQSLFDKVTKGPLEVLANDGPLTWNGITVFGTYDMGLGYYSHGYPQSSQLYTGEALLGKFSNNPYFGAAPNNLSQTTLGIKGKIEVLPGLYGVFWASTGIEPNSGQLSNAPASVIANNGLNRNVYSILGDGSRGGQAFNDQLYVGAASDTFGQLTFGRHKTFSNDMIAIYDPAGGSYAFSVIGYSGTPVAGLGDTANGRWDDALKYRVEYGPVHFGVMYKFIDGNGGSNIGNGTAPAGVTRIDYASHNDAGQLNFGGSYARFDIDGVLGYFHQAISTGTPLSSAQLGASTFTSNGGTTVTTTASNNANTLSATASDNEGGAIGVRYTWNQFKFYAGWSHDVYRNPAHNVGVGAQNDQGGYILSQVTNAAFPNAKVLDTEWGGVRYSYDPKTDIVAGYYHEGQNAYGTAANLATCGMARYVASTQASPRSGTCAGDLNAGSLFVDYHFTKRFDVYAGMMVSGVSGGIASGYYYTINWAPAAGLRFTF